jgi:hypothetical protein
VFEASYSQLLQQLTATYQSAIFRLARPITYSHETDPCVGGARTDRGGDWLAGGGNWNSSVTATATATAAASRAYLNIWSLVLSFVAYELQDRELVLNLMACPAALVTLNTLFILIITVKLNYLLDIIRDNCYSSLYYFL